jgi:hypothetical protein
VPVASANASDKARISLVMLISCDQRWPFRTMST